jgi:hypothetical protein
MLSELIELFASDCACFSFVYAVYLHMYYFLPSLSYILYLHQCQYVVLPFTTVCLPLAVTFKLRAASTCNIFILQGEI